MIGCTATGAVNDTEAAGITCPNRIAPPHTLIIQSLNTPVSKVQVVEYTYRERYANSHVDSRQASLFMVDVKALVNMSNLW